MAPQLADIHYELKKLSNKEITEHSKKFLIQEKVSMAMEIFFLVSGCQY